MKFDEMRDRILVLDGAMGTMIQASGCEMNDPPEILSSVNPKMIALIHKQYLDAGADVIYANTFGANRFKYEGLGYNLENVIGNSVRVAKAVAENKALVALSIGPTGKLMNPMGDLSFNEAYEAFKEIAVSGYKAGADLAVIETMADLLEAKAAVLAVKENTDLPVFVSMSFEKNGRTFAGCSIECMAATMEALQVDAIGINCSLGPVEIYPLARELCRHTDLPVFIKANAGMPDPQTGAYSISATEFADVMQEYVKLGVNMMGGCCGTTPEYIANVARMLSNQKPCSKALEKENGKVCSGTRALTFDHKIIIGERINPTGKKRLKQALEERDYDYIAELAVKQVGEGAEILDVNVGAPGIDEVEVLPEVVQVIQSVTDVPLMIDSANAGAINAALRVYNGKPVINSIDCEFKKLSELLPVIKHYGAAVVGLTLDEKGIPETAAGRLKIAEKILSCTRAVNIKDEDVIIDCLTLAVSAKPDAAQVTLKAVELVKNDLKIKTVLGVSNVSFGLPERSVINRYFLALAMEKGLDMAIMNPGDSDMIDAVATIDLLKGADKNAENYIRLIKERDIAKKTEIVKETEGIEKHEDEIKPTVSKNTAPVQEEAFFENTETISDETSLYDKEKAQKDDLEESVDEDWKLAILEGLESSRKSFVNEETEKKEDRSINTVGTTSFESVPAKSGINDNVSNSDDIVGKTEDSGFSFVLEDVDNKMFEESYETGINEDKTSAELSDVPASETQSEDIDADYMNIQKNQLEYKEIENILSLMVNGLNREMEKTINSLLNEKDGFTVMNNYLIPALDEVGRLFEDGDVFLPQMLQAANVAQVGFDIIKDRLSENKEIQVSKGTVILATVQGDIHDIGKNIVKTIMSNYGYDIIDMGKDVPPEAVADAVVKNDVMLVGLSALMTTTLPAMEETIKAVKKVKPSCKVMVGGAVLTRAYAKKIGADFYCHDAVQSAKVARFVLGN